MKSNFLFLSYLFLLAISAHAADRSSVSFGINCYETNANYEFEEERSGKITVLDTHETLFNSDKHKFSFPSRLSKTRSFANPVNIDLIINPTIFVGKLYNYVKFDHEMNTYDPYDGTLLNSRKGLNINLSDHAPRKKFGKFATSVFAANAFEPYLKCDMEMNYVASNTAVIPERISFKAQIIYDISYWNREMSTITDCSLAINESCDIFLHTIDADGFFKPSNPPEKHEIKLIDIAIDPITDQKVLFMIYRNKTYAIMLTDKIAGDSSVNNGYSAEELYIKK